MCGFTRTIYPDGFSTSSAYDAEGHCIAATSGMARRLAKATRDAYQLSVKVSVENSSKVKPNNVGL